MFKRTNPHDVYSFKRLYLPLNKLPTLLVTLINKNNNAGFYLSFFFFLANYQKALTYLKRAEELSNVESDGGTIMNVFASDSEIVTPAKQRKVKSMAESRPQAPVFEEKRHHEPVPQERK